MICEARVIKSIQDRMTKYCDKVRQESRISKLWLQYIDMVELLRKFINAERTGNWQLHLQTLQTMIPYMAAVGHNMHAKSAYLYLVNILKVTTRKPGPLWLFHEKLSCDQKEWKVLGRFIKWLSNWADANEEFEKCWRFDKRPVHNRDSKSCLYSLATCNVWHKWSYSEC